MSKNSKCSQSVRYSEVDSKESILGKEEEDSKVVNSKIKKIICKVDNLIEAAGEAEFNPSYSQLIRIAEISPQHERSIEKLNKSLEMEIDLDSDELENLLRSGVKSQSPVRNLNFRNFDQILSQHKKTVQKSLLKRSTALKEKEKIVVNFSQGGFEIPEEDLELLFDNMSTRRKSDKESEETYSLCIENVNNISIEGCANFGNTSVKHNCDAFPIFKFIVNEMGSFFNNLSERFKEEINKGLIENKQNSIKNSDQKIYNSIKGKSNIAVSSKKRKEDLIFDDEDFDIFLKNIKSSQSQSQRNICNMNMNVNPFTNANKIRSVHDNSIKFEFTSNGNNNSASNKKNNITEVSDTINPRDLKDDEFDNFLKDVKNKKVEIKNEFVTGKNLNHKGRELVPANETTSVIEDCEFDSFIQTVKDKKKGVKGFKPPNVISNKENKDNYIRSDFKCGDRNVSFKADKRVQSIMQEMEEDVDDFSHEYVEEDVKKNKVHQMKPAQVNKSNPSFVPPKVNKPKVIQSSNSKTKLLTSKKKFKVNDFSSEKLNSKRVFSDHLRSLDSESRKKENVLQNNKKFKTNGQFKIVNEIKPPSKLPKKKEELNLKEIQILNKSSYYLDNIETCNFNCLCSIENKTSCGICVDGPSTINTLNFPEKFIKYYNLKLNSKTNQDKFSFISYVYKLSCWKYYLISKYLEDASVFNFANVLKHVKRKFDTIYEEGRRSFLIKVAEKDSSINKNMILMLLDYVKTNEGMTLSLTDGYKSVYSSLEAKDPICSLITRGMIIKGMKLNIGLSKVERITEDFKIFISIYFNSLTKASMDSKLGVKKEKFTLKNLSCLREDGGEVALIDVFIIKKYDYYCTDFNKKEKFSSSKLEKYLEDYENAREEKENIGASLDNLIYTFKIVCVDSLIYLNALGETNIKTGLKTNLSKKCIIEFRVKNRHIYDNINSAKRFRLGLLNLGKSSNINKSFYNDPKVLYLKANDSVLISEIKINKTNQERHSNVLNDICQSIGVKNEEVDSSDYLISHSYIGNSLTNEEVTFYGQFLNLVKKDDKSILLFFSNQNNNLAIIKLHEENFYDVHSLKVGNVFSFKNLNFKIVYYYDELGSSLITYKSDRRNVNDQCVVFYFESSNYSTFKRMMKNSPECSKFKATSAYDESLLRNIIKCV